MLFKQFTSAAITAIFASLASNVHGHGYMVSPRSRNYVAKQDGKWGGDETTPYPESCPHCLNVGGTETTCGKVEGRNYDYPKNALGGNLAPAVQACYSEGDVVELDVVLTAHHMGHFSYKACAINAGEVASQECFDSNPLTFVEDVLYGSRPDPNFPNRAYIPRRDAAFIQTDNNGHWKFTHRFKLPEGLSGDLVGVCNSIPPNGRGLPEQFWNCAEIRVAPDCTSNPPPPSPTNPSPTGGVSPPSPSSGTCGDGNRGNGICSDGKCCSQYGWCGSSSAHCSGGGGGVSPPSPSSGTCGDGNRGNGICSDGKCCSQFGWCGSSAGHCSDRMLRGMNATEEVLELEMGAEVSDENSSIDVALDQPVITETEN
eukprot:scaffold9175_cov115-Skeletonema_marinoi.AAC.3